jgi:hypothetical protein
MELYIGNPTNSTNQFTWRQLESGNLRFEYIAPGAQICIQNLQQEEANNILAQHEKYGLCHVKELKGETNLGSLVYDYSPITTSRIRDANEHYKEVIEERSKEARANTVSASDKQIDAVGGARTEVSIEEEPAIPGDDVAFAGEVISVGDEPKGRGRPRKA